MPSREDMAEEGVAGGGGEELEEGPEGYLNLGLLLMLLAPEFPESRLTAAALALVAPLSWGEAGGSVVGGVVLLLLLPPGLLSPNLSLYKAADDPRLLFPLDFCC